MMQQRNVFLLVALFQLTNVAAATLRATRLRITPTVVERGADATLACLYELRGAPLYSVKWYRGRHEFYRYSPSEQPETKIFPFVGINVDLARSNESQVVLVRVGFMLSGNFTCEVTADAPSFSTSVVSNYMEVVSFPEHPPRLATERGSYAPGDVLRANCSAPPARPAPVIYMFLNNDMIKPSHAQTGQAGEGLQWSEVGASVRLLPAHYDRGPLVLRCEALIGDVYRETNELVLHLVPGDPRLQRVTSKGLSSRVSMSKFKQLLFIQLLILIIEILPP